ncbi:hypothetical protein ACOSQ2_012187 [Xanthoceras sorbifolium]
MEEGNAGPNPRRKDFIFASLLPRVDKFKIFHNLKAKLRISYQSFIIHSPRIVLYLANVDRSSAVSGASPAPSTGSPRSPTAK